MADTSITPGCLLQEVRRSGGGRCRRRGETTVAAGATAPLIRGPVDFAVHRSLPPVGRDLSVEPPSHPRWSWPGGTDTAAGGAVSVGARSRWISPERGGGPAW